MTYLVDVNVLSEPTKPRFQQKVVDWLAEHDSEIVTDAVVMGEVWEGIVSLPPGRKQQALKEWFAEICASVRCLDWTMDTAICWAELRDDVRRRGFTVPVKDTLTAATAKRYGLVVATRDTADFARCGVPVVNPFE